VTLNQMIARVRSYIDEKSEKNFTNDFIIESLNVGQDEVQSEIVKLNVGFFEKPAELNPAAESPGTIAGVAAYLLPSDFLSFRRVEYKTSGLPLSPIDLNEKTQQGNDLTSRLMHTDTGLSYFRSGNTVVFDPTPQSVIELVMWYVYRITRLTTTTAGSFVCEIPEEYHDMVCVAAAIDARIKDEGKTTDLEKKWYRHLNRLQTTLGDWQTQEPKMVGGSANR
jgi:hypothetical protein